MYKKIFFTVLIVITSLLSFGQDEWEFANSTPQKLVKSHFYFLEKGHKNIDIALFTIENTELNRDSKVSRIIHLKKILEKLNINIEDISNRRKWILGDNKYILIKSEPKIYLIREQRKWYYSKETIESIPLLYNKYILGYKAIKDKESKKLIDKEVHNAIPDTVSFTINLSTPYNAVVSHLVFTDDSLLDITKASQCINTSNLDSSKSEDIAIKLKQVFLASSQKIFDFNTLSKDSFYLDTASNMHRYWPNPKFPELYLEKIGDNWLYSKNTAALINSVHSNIYEEDAEVIFHFSDKFKRAASKTKIKNIGQLQTWQILMILYFVVILLLIHFINKILIKRVLLKLLNKYRAKHIVYQLIHTLSFLIALNIIKDYGPSFVFPIDIQHTFLQFIAISKIFVSTLFAVYFVNLLVILFTKENSYDNRFGLVFFLSLLAKLIIFTVSLLFVIKALEYNLINFLAGLSIGGFALALGAQDTIKNFFGSLMIFADDSFNAGDWIETKDVSGTVEKIGLRSTRVRTFHNSLVTVPNSNLSDNNIDNMGKRIYRRYSGKILLEYATPHDKIEEFIEKIKEQVETTENIRKDFYMVYISNLDKLGIEIMIYVFFKVDDWDQEMAEKHKLLLKVLDIKNELGINFSKVPVLE